MGISLFFQAAAVFYSAAMELNTIIAIAVSCAVVLAIAVYLAVSTSLLKKKNAAGSKTETSAGSPDADKAETELKAEERGLDEEITATSEQPLKEEEDVKAAAAEVKTEDEAAAIKAEEEVAAVNAEAYAEKAAVIFASGEKSAVGTKETEEEVKSAPKIITVKTDDPFSSIAYVKSFSAKLIQSEDKIKGYYSQIKNEMLKYKKIKSRTAWSKETFKLGKEPKLKLAFSGQTLIAYLAIDPKQFEETKIKVKDMSAKKPHAQTPTAVRLRADKNLKTVLQLIPMLMLEPAKKFEAADYTALLSYAEMDELIERKLVKVKVKAAKEGEV